MTAEDIIDLLGGVAAVSNYTSWPYSTVRSWSKYNQIPDWRQTTLLRMALENGKPLSATDFPSANERVAA